MRDKAAKGSFGWSVGVGHSALAYLSNIRLDEFYLDPSACGEAFRAGRKRIIELFGPEVTLPAISCPHISYGHAACLGAEITFPEDSEPGIRPIYSSIDEGIAALEKDINFEKNGLLQHYLSIYRHLQRSFPGEKVTFRGFGWEGPITSAVLLRGQDFYLDLYDEPLKVKQFLGLLTESIVRFVHFIRGTNGKPPVDPQGGSLADDFASLIPPTLWSEFVIPYWDQYYCGITTGERRIHVENLAPDHLPYLEMVCISFYDPSVSPKLGPRVIRERINIPFTWRLPCFQYPYLSEKNVRDWVIQAVMDGAPHIHTIISPIMCQGDNPAKVRVFIEAAREVEERYSKPGSENLDTGL